MNAMCLSGFYAASFLNWPINIRQAFYTFVSLFYMAFHITDI